MSFSLNGTNIFISLLYEVIDITILVSSLFVIWELSKILSSSSFEGLFVTYTISSNLNTLLYCLSGISTIESRIPNPANIRAVHPSIPPTVINTRFLYLNKFLTVILFEKLIRFQINGIRSSITLFPFDGALGLIRSDGFSLTTFLIVKSVVPQIHIVAIKIPITEFVGLKSYLNTGTSNNILYMPQINLGSKKNPNKAPIIPPEIVARPEYSKYFLLMCLLLKPSDLNVPITPLSSSTILDIDIRLINIATTKNIVGNTLDKFETLLPSSIKLEYPLSSNLPYIYKTAFGISFNLSLASLIFKSNMALLS